MGRKILTINPGSTSTKVALFDGDEQVLREELKVDAEEVRNFPLMLDQLPLRKRDMLAFLERNNIDVAGLDMIVCRGGSMNGVRCYSGYIIPEDGARDEVIIFSILTGNCTSENWKVRPLLDKLMAMLAR